MCFDETFCGCPCGCMPIAQSCNQRCYIVGPRGPQGPQGPQGEPGVVTPAAAGADTVVTDATATTNAETINAILAALRAAGLMET